MISIGDKLWYESIDGCWYEKEVSEVAVNEKGARKIKLKNGVWRFEFDILQGDSDVRIKEPVFCEDCLEYDCDCEK